MQDVERPHAVMRRRPFSRRQRHRSHETGWRVVNGLGATSQPVATKKHAKAAKLAYGGIFRASVSDPTQGTPLL